MTRSSFDQCLSRHLWPVQAVNTHWTREVTVTQADLVQGDFQSRGRNPVARAIAGVLRPGVTVYADIGDDELYLSDGQQSLWMGLPEAVLPYANRVVRENCTDELVLTIKFTPWALPTERWVETQIKK